MDTQETTQKTSELRLVIHTQYGIITLETWDKDEIMSAIQAMADTRSEKLREADSRNRKPAA